MSTTVSILGCGWLGTALGKSLLRKGWNVKGSTSSTKSCNDLEMTGISTFYVKVKPKGVEVDYNSFFSTDVLIVSIPPTRTDCVEESYPQKVNQIAQKAEEIGISKVLFISSSSVYESQNKEVREGDEGSPEKQSGRALIKAEKVLTHNPKFKTTVIRFGGLIGYDRNPVKFLIYKSEVAGETPVNLIHRDDCVGIITQIIEKDIWGETFNASSPEHPVKREFYSKAAKISELPAPVFSNTKENYKIVNSDKLINALDYKFKYQSPMDYLKEVEEWAYRI
ncbi:sugar nucleotide-binding protein [Prolixibacteraceae bacterium Z1-6]|uniref:Sugar nucleotide-binding protein n=1 Tax=Draconibacterium aestuarii TaxID=2998507 RepID=A0A9X3F3C7_9BACT|nr:sugar nucleotide-binding protein [Prolixibacteraceae bacterium Z1-6]